MTLDSDGDITSAQEYYPYGSFMEEGPFNYTYNNAETNDLYKFTEKERDKETGYDYFACPPQLVF